MHTVQEWEPLHLRGAPPQLSAVLPRGCFAEGTVPLSLTLPLQHSSSRCRPKAWIEALGCTGLTCLQIELPEVTPPGDYPGTIEIEKEKRSIVVEITPRIEMRILPAATRVKVRAGAREKLALTIVNLGNIPIDVPEKSVFGVYDKLGLDSAIGSAFTTAPSEDCRRIDRLIDEMSSGHGGVILLKVIDGAGPLNPCEARQIQLELRIPKKAAPGHDYWGIWTLCDYNYKIEIDIPPEETKSSGAGRPS